MNGELSVLDMDDGHEQSLTNSVELFWVTCSQYEEKGNLIKEVSWLDYGHKGMQVSFIVFFFIIFKELCLSLLIDRTSFHILLSFYPTLLFFFFGRCGTQPMEEKILNKYLVRVLTSLLSFAIRSVNLSIFLGEKLDQNHNSFICCFLSCIELLLVVVFKVNGEHAICFCSWIRSLNLTVRCIRLVFFQMLV